MSPVQLRRPLSGRAQAEVIERLAEPGPRPIAPVREKLTQFDLNLPLSRIVEMYMSSGMLNLGCRTRAGQSTG